MPRPKADSEPQGDPECLVALPTGSVVGLRILGLKSEIMLGIREDTEGQPVSCAVTNELLITYPLQNNPRRKADHGPDK